MQSPGSGPQDPDAETQRAGVAPPGGWPADGRPGGSGPYGSQGYGSQGYGANSYGSGDEYDDADQTRIVSDSDDYGRGTWPPPSPARDATPDAGATPPADPRYPYPGGPGGADPRTQVLPEGYGTSPYGTPGAAGSRPGDPYPSAGYPPAGPHGEAPPAGGGQYGAAPGADAYGTAGYPQQGGYPAPGTDYNQGYQQGYPPAGGYPQQGYQQPGYQQPAYPQGGYQQAYPQQGYEQPGYQQPGDYGYPGSGGQGGANPGRKRAIIIGAAVVAVLLLIIIPVALLAGGGSDDKPTTAAAASLTPTTPPTTPATTSPSPSASPTPSPSASASASFSPAESALLAKLDDSAMTDCEPNASAEGDHIQAALFCNSDDGKVVAAYSYATTADLNSDEEVRKSLVTTSDGKCKEGGDEVFTWNFDNGQTQGTAVCNTRTNDHFLYWSYTSKLVAFMATGTDGAALYEWWSGFDPVPQS